MATIEQSLISAPPMIVSGATPGEPPIMLLQHAALVRLAALSAAV